MIAVVPHKNRNVVVVGLAIALAVCGIVVGALGLLQARSAKSDFATTSRQLATTSHRLATTRQGLASVNLQLAASQTAILSLKANSQAGTVSTLHTSLNTLQAQLAQFMVCVPELQQEISDLSINSTQTGGYLNSAYLSNSTIVSSNCSKMLQGP